MRVAHLKITSAEVILLRGGSSSRDKLMFPWLCCHTFKNSEQRRQAVWFRVFFHGQFYTAFSLEDISFCYQHFKEIRSLPVLCC